ncbi:MAG TPA: hypothetical protein VKE96_12440 [Vicinamibacterales bacterium]|nr:hypothetical protein [Vicinamibacterales bacterium]
MPANTVGAFTLPDPRNVPKDYYANVPTIDPHVNDLVKQYISDKKLKANQNDPSALHDITSYLRSQGVNAQTDYTDVNGHTGGILVADANGNLRPYQLIDGSNNWTQLQAWKEGASAPRMFPAATTSSTTTPPPTGTTPPATSSLYLNPTGQLYTPNTIRDFV